MEAARRAKQLEVQNLQVAMDEFNAAGKAGGKEDENHPAGGPASLDGRAPIVEERANSEPPQRATETAMASEKEEQALHKAYMEAVEKGRDALRKAKDLNAKWMEEENSRAWEEETPAQANGKEERELRRSQANREAQEARKAEEEARVRYNQFQEEEAQDLKDGNKR